MTLPAQNPSQSAVAAGGQTVVPFTFRCDDSALLTVYVNDVEQGAPVVALNPDQLAHPGGTVTLAPLTAGDIVTIERETPQTQTLALTSYNPFTATALIAGLDRMVEMLQEFWAKLSRAPVHTRKNMVAISTTDLPPPVPGLVLGWIADGAKFKLANANPNTITAVISNVAGTLVKHEPVGVGDGATAVFNLAHVPTGDAYLDINVGPAWMLPDGTRYIRVGAVITFQAGHIPPNGEKIYADYWY